MLDLGCGSGAIGLAIAQELAARGLGARVIGVDVSEGALAVARANARKHGLTEVSFVRSDWFGGLDASWRGRVHLVVANPPYVGAEELAGLDPVLAHEPRGALVAPDHDGVAGFADAAAIVAAAPAWLAPGGALVLEHGDRQGPAALAAARDAGLEAVDRRDLAGRDRVLIGRRR